MSTDDSSDRDESAHPYETAESFHPMGSEWEDRMREELEDTDYDADLGMQMARDAQRLVAGELSEEEFYAAYHDDVEAEFETDERPIFDDLEGVNLDDLSDDQSMLQSLQDVDLEGDDVSRRNMMKKMGAAGLFMGYSAFATYDNDQEEEIPERVSGIRPADEDEREHRWGMVIDLERCDGCLSCVTGCIDENGTSTGANWMYVFTYDDEQSDEENFLVRPCQHCSNAPCAKVCPVRARHTREKDGLVLTNYETCIGCRYCQVACPYGVNYFQWGEPDVEMGRFDHYEERPSDVRAMDFEERQSELSEVNDHVYDERGWWVDSRPPNGVMGKCTMCPSRQDGHTHNPKGTVACMDACDEAGMSAIHFGDMDAEVGEDYDRAVRYLEERTGKPQEEGTAKFDTDISFDVNVDEPIDFGGGYYSLSLVERPPDGEEWEVFDTADVIVADTSLPESMAFAESSLGNFGAFPSAALEVLYRGEETNVPATIVADEDAFEVEDESDLESIDVTASIRLGGDGATLASQELTLDADDPTAEVNFEVDVDEIDRDDGVHVMHLVVDSAVETDQLEADQQGTLLTTDRPNIATPEIPFDASGRDGTMTNVPGILYRDLPDETDEDAEPVTIGAEIAYPSTDDVEREIALVLYDGEDIDIVAFQEYTYEQRRTSNTGWDGKLSTFKLLEEIGTEPNITYIGNEPGPKAEQKERGPVAYDELSSQWPVEVKDNRKEHLDYGAGGPPEEEEA